MEQSRFRNPHFREGSIGHVGITRVRHRLKGQWSSERSRSWSRERPRDRRNPLQKWGRHRVRSYERPHHDGPDYDDYDAPDRGPWSYHPVGAIKDCQLVSLGVVRGRLCVATLTLLSLSMATGDAEATKSHDHRFAHHDVQLILLLLALDLITLTDEARAVVLPCLSLEANAADDHIGNPPWSSLRMTTNPRLDPRSRLLPPIDSLALLRSNSSHLLFVPRDPMNGKRLTLLSVLINPLSSKKLITLVSRSSHSP